MSRKFKSKVGANQRPLIGGGKEYTPPPEPPNLAAKFIRENRGGIPDEDTPAMDLAGEPVSAVTPPAPASKPDTPPAEPVVPDAAAPPPSDAPPADAPVQGAIEDPTTPPDTAGGSGDLPFDPAKPPVSAEAPTAAPTVAAPVARDEYDPREPIKLLDGEQEWTRSDIVTGLQERATLQQELQSARAAATERDQMLKSIGAPDVKTAITRFIEPFTNALRENPARGPLLDEVAAMDPATINYVTQLINDFKQLPPDQRATFGTVGPSPSAQAPTDPRYDKLAANQELLENSLLQQRAEREVTSILNDWPFLRQDRKAWEAVQAVATAMYNEDEAKNIPPLQRRGYMEAIAQQRHFLEIMKSAQERRVMAHASAAATPAPRALGEPPATSAILPTTKPAPPVSSRPPVLKEYRGPLDGAAAAFLADQGYTK
jgi:hypothetical protein